MNFLSTAREVTMNPDNVNTETLKELHTKLVLPREKWLLDLIAYTEYIVKYTETFSQFWLWYTEVSSTTKPLHAFKVYPPDFNTAERKVGYTQQHVPFPSHSHKYICMHVMFELKPNTLSLIFPTQLSTAPHCAAAYH